MIALFHFYIRYDAHAPSLLAPNYSRCNAAAIAPLPILSECIRMRRTATGPPRQYHPKKGLKSAAMTEPTRLGNIFGLTNEATRQKARARRTGDTKLQKKQEIIFIADDKRFHVTEAESTEQERDHRAKRRGHRENGKIP